MLSKIIKKLFPTPNIETKEEKPKLDSNAITIILDSNNEPYIHIAITELDIEKAVCFGKMLSDLNCGYYSSSITNILFQLAKNDDSISLFVGNALSSWSLQNKINSINTTENNDPIIKPTDFIKSIKNE